MISLAIAILLSSVEQLQAVGNFRVDSLTIDPVTIPGNHAGSCAPLEARQAAIKTLQNDFKRSIAVAVTECGEGLWYQVAHIDMNDPQQQCPTEWREYTNSSVRVCGRPLTTSSSCASTSYTTGRRYSKVCGRVIGYQVASPDGFQSDSCTIDQNYVDGSDIFLSCSSCR